LKEEASQKKEASTDETSMPSFTYRSADLSIAEE